MLNRSQYLRKYLLRAFKCFNLCFWTKVLRMQAFRCDGVLKKMEPHVTKKTLFKGLITKQKEFQHGVLKKFNLGRRAAVFPAGSPRLLKLRYKYPVATAVPAYVPDN